MSPISTHSPSVINLFKNVVVPARSFIGVGSLDVPRSSGWSHKDINTNDPIEVAHASSLQDSALAHIAASTSKAHVSPWNAFVIWWLAILKLRRPLPADDITVA